MACTSSCPTQDHESSWVCRTCGNAWAECGWYYRKSGPKAGERLTPCRSCSIAKRVAWSRANPEKHRESMRRQRTEKPRAAWDIRLRSTFGITADQYDQLLREQGGVCAICESPEPMGRGRFHIDHNHNCCPGKKSCGACIRGLLCTRCNSGLAMFQDSIEALERALAYVTEPMLSRLSDTGGA